MVIALYSGNIFEMLLIAIVRGLWKLCANWGCGKLLALQ